jgi:hypothetical protein
MVKTRIISGKTVLTIAEPKPEALGNTLLHLTLYKPLAAEGFLQSDWYTFSEGICAIAAETA